MVSKLFIFLGSIAVLLLVVFVVLPMIKPETTIDVINDITNSNGDVSLSDVQSCVNDCVVNYDGGYPGECKSIEYGSTYQEFSINDCCCFIIDDSLFDSSSPLDNSVNCMVECNNIDYPFGICATDETNCIDSTGDYFLSDDGCQVSLNPEAGCCCFE